MNPARTDEEMLEVAIAEARAGLAEGGIPIGAAVFDSAGTLLGAGHNRRVQEGDPSAHGETDAFRRAGRQRSYRGMTMVTTLAPCWYCSGLVRQFGFSRLVVGESETFRGGAGLAEGERGRGGRPRLGRVQAAAWRVHQGAPGDLERGYRGVGSRFPVRGSRLWSGRTSWRKPDAGVPFDSAAPLSGRAPRLRLG